MNDAIEFNLFNQQITTAGNDQRNIVINKMKSVCYKASYGLRKISWKIENGKCWFQTIEYEIEKYSYFFISYFFIWTTLR